MDTGTYVEHGGRPAVRFERSYPCSVERVWQAITNPKELEQWFPSKVELEPQEGGKVEFSGDPNMENSIGAVLHYDPPRRLSFSWGNDELHFELKPSEDGCRLTLIDVLESSDAAARNAAGWVVCIDELDRVLAGKPTDGVASVPTAKWQKLYDDYVENGMPSGAPIPGATSNAP